MAARSNGGPHSYRRTTARATGGPRHALPSRPVPGGRTFGGPRTGRGVTAERPVAFVDHDVVAAAEQAEVVEVGRPAVDPVVQMVGVGPFDLAMTAGEDAAAVAVSQGAPLRGRDHPCPVTQVEDLR